MRDISSKEESKRMDKSGLRRRGHSRQGFGASCPSSPFASPLKLSSRGGNGGLVLGSPLKGHQNRLPFCDLTNSESKPSGYGNKNSINSHMSSTWNFVSKNKAGDLGMETFKKFLEKKNGVKSKPKPSESGNKMGGYETQQSLLQNKNTLDERMMLAVGSPEHRNLVQNAESAKSPWSYQLQVPLWPLNMTLGLSVQEDDEMKQLKEEYVAQAAGYDGNYLKEKLFSNADYEFGKSQSAASNGTAKKMFALPESKFVGTCKKKKSASAAKDDEEEIKLPTPTLIANQNKSSSIAEVVDVVDVEAQAPLPEAFAPAAASSIEVGEGHDLQAVALFPVEDEEKSVAIDEVDIEMPVADVRPLGAEVEESLEEGLLDNSTVSIHIEGGLEAPVQKNEEEEVKKRSKPPPPPPRRRNKEEDCIRAAEDKQPTQTYESIATFVNPLVHKFCATPEPERKVEQIEASTTGIEGAEESYCAEDVEEVKRQDSARKIARAYAMFGSSRLMRVMMKLRDDNVRLATLVESVETTYPEYHAKYSSLVDSITTSASPLPCSTSIAIKLHSEIECTIQALVDSREKAKNYQRAYKKHQELEKASTTIQRMWRKKRIENKKNQVLLSCRNTIAATQIQIRWREYKAGKDQVTPQATATKRITHVENIESNARASVSPASIHVTPVSNWADAVDAASCEKKETASRESESTQLREELANLRKELEMLKSEVNERQPNAKRGRSATRRRGRSTSKNRGKRSFSASRGSQSSDQIGAQLKQAKATDGQPKQSRSLSRGRRRRKSMSCEPKSKSNAQLSSDPIQRIAAAPKSKQAQNAVVAKTANNSDLSKPADKQKKSQSKGRQKGSKSKGSNPLEEIVMNCPPPGLASKTSNFMSNQRKKMSEKKSSSFVASSYYKNQKLWKAEA